MHSADASWTASARASRAGPALTATSPQQQTSAAPTRTAALVACAMVLLACATVREATAGRSASRAGARGLGAARAQPRATSMLLAMERAGKIILHDVLSPNLKTKTLLSDHFRQLRRSKLSKKLNSDGPQTKRCRRNDHDLHFTRFSRSDEETLGCLSEKYSSRNRLVVYIHTHLHNSTHACTYYVYAYTYHVWFAAQSKTKRSKY